MKLPGKNPGYGNRGKTNYVFPPFPQPLLLLKNYDLKQRLKTTTIVYTKSLADPPLNNCDPFQPLHGTVQSLVRDTID